MPEVRSGFCTRPLSGEGRARTPGTATTPISWPTSNTPPSRLGWARRAPATSSAPDRHTAFVAGYGLHAGRVIDGDDRAGLERLCRYGARAPIANTRLHPDADGHVINGADLLRRVFAIDGLRCDRCTAPCASWPSSTTPRPAAPSSSTSSCPPSHQQKAASTHLGAAEPSHPHLAPSRPPRCRATAPASSPPPYS